MRVNQSKVIFPCPKGTLDELREIVAATAGLPETTVVRVRVRLGLNADGTCARRITMVPDPSLTTMSRDGETDGA